MEIAIDDPGGIVDDTSPRFLYLSYATVLRRLPIDLSTASLSHLRGFSECEINERTALSPESPINRKLQGPDDPLP
jgi:hypothetical protein